MKAKNPSMVSRDKFILNKGHAAAALYATLANVGFFEKINYYNMDLTTQIFSTCFTLCSRCRVFYRIFRAWIKLGVVSISL